MSTTESTARSFLSQTPASRIVCIGDVMLDRFVYGTVDRISPEAPIPVMNANDERLMLGGAGNVARNLTSLGVNCTLIGVVGEDADARSIRDLAQAASIDLQLVVESGRRTTSKWRFLAGSQQLLRTDWETVGDVSLESADSLAALIEGAIAGAHAIVISDYGKGVLTDPVLQRCITQAAARAVPVVVDPKGTNYARYRGATVVTPNKKELSEAVQGAPVDSDEDIGHAAQQLLQTAGVHAVLATRGAQGMAVVRNGEAPWFRRSLAQEVFDVSGAGDTVVAVLAAGLAQGRDLIEAADLANAGAGVVVSKLGTSVVEPDELLAAFRSSYRSRSDHKLLNLEAAKEQVTRWRLTGQKVGFTNGCFDLLHPGHIHLMEQARGQCDRLVVGLNSDASVTRLKGEARPIYDVVARATLLGSLACVDAVVVFEEDTPLNVISALLPDVLVKGADYTRATVVGHELVESAGGRVFLADLKAGFSTTNTVNRLS